MSNVGSSIFHLGSFCSGVGLLDIAARLALEYHGIRTRSVFMSEWDAYAAAVLRSRMEDSSLEPCPIWCGDLREFPAEDFCGMVDGIAAGFPCQDISYAGKGAGIMGSRSGLWFDILEAAVRMECRWLFLENVAAITVRGLDAVQRSLAEAGFASRWMCLQASQVGASHRRDRWFCVANRDCSQWRKEDTEGRNTPERLHGIHHGRKEGSDRTGRGNNAVAVTPQRGQRKLRQSPQLDGQPDGGDEAVGDTFQQGSEEHRKIGFSNSERGERAQAAAERTGGEFVGDTECSNSRSRDKQEASTQKRRNRLAEPSLFAPGPGDSAWQRIAVEQPHLLPAIERGVCVLADGQSLVLDESRADQLRCSGNGVVVLQAATAFVELLRIMEQQNGR